MRSHFQSISWTVNVSIQDNVKKLVGDFPKFLKIVNKDIFENVPKNLFLSVSSLVSIPTFFVIADWLCQWEER
jgi:hypothetical protein